MCLFLIAHPYLGYIPYYTASILFCVDEKWFISILHPCLSYITYCIASIKFCVDEKWPIFILCVDDKWSSSTCQASYGCKGAGYVQ